MLSPISRSPFPLLNERGISVGDYPRQAGETDDTGRIQRAYNAAVSATTSLIFPAGTFTVSSPIQIGTTAVPFIGMGITSTVIQASATLNAIFQFTDSAENNYPSFEHMTLDGNSKANYGVISAKIAHALFYRMRVINTLTAAVSVGYGWDIDFLECEILNNTGDGIVTSQSANNALNLTNTKIYNNSGFALKVSNAYTVNVHGCTIEKNAKGGVYCVGGVYGLNIKDNYFEANAGTGYTFATPALTINADIIVNGSSDPTTFAFSNVTEAVSIEGNTHQCYSPAASILYVLINANNVTIRNNRNINGTVDLIGLYGDTSVSSVSNVRVENNKGHTNKYNIIGGFLQYAPLNLSTFLDEQVQRRNYAKQSPFDYSSLIANSGGTVMQGRSYYNQWRTLELSNFAGNSDVFGFSLDLTNSYPELQGQVVYFGAWVYANGSNMNVKLYCDQIGYDANANNFAAYAWKWKEFQVKLPTSGTVKFGFQVTGGVDFTNYGLIANPVLALVGSNKENFFQTVSTPTYKAPGNPTWGLWYQGDVVYNSAPAASGTIGWVATTTGYASNSPWTTGTAYQVGKRVSSNGNCYECTTAGTAGSTAPSGTGTGISDGGATWKYVIALPTFKTFGSISA